MSGAALLPMTWFEIYALFGTPLIAVAIGVGALYFTRHGRHHLHPGE